ncbi:MAG: aminomethyltransferase family protein [Acidobacteriota bacterium]
MPVNATLKSPLFEHAQALGAHFLERDGVLVPGDYGAVRAEHAALRERAAVIDLAHFGALRVRGRDRVAWLHKLTTANVQSLAEGAGNYALLLNAKGHVVADFVLVVRHEQDGLLLYTTRGAIGKLRANLRRAIFREQVALEDTGESVVIMSVQGLNAAQGIAGTLGSLPPLEPFRSAQVDQLLVVRHPRADGDGFDLLAPRERAVELWDALVGQGIRPAGLEALNIARIEAGIPWYADDFDETMLAPEARLDRYIAENKGCYTGQEVIARIKNLGHVNRLLTRFQVQGEAVPDRGDLIFAEDREVGWVTSAVYSFARQAPLAFGYIRREWAEVATNVQIARGAVRLNATVIPTP